MAEKWSMQLRGMVNGIVWQVIIIDSMLFFFFFTYYQASLFVVDLLNLLVTKKQFTLV